jgi:hypothetical protein
MNLSNLRLQAQVIAGGTENLNDVLGIRQLQEKGGRRPIVFASDILNLSVS